MDAYYNESSPLDDLVLDGIGSFYLTMFLLSLFFNLTLILIFIRNSELRIRRNIFILIITIFNLFGSTVFPILIHSNFNHSLQTWKFGCILSGFVIYFSACTNVYLMTFISIERYYILKYPVKVKVLNKNKIIIAVLASIGLGLFWSMAPLLGWSKYALEDSKTCCSVEWKERSLNVMSYNILVFIFVFAIPFSLILVSNLQSIIIVTNK